MMRSLIGRMKLGGLVLPVECGRGLRENPHCNTTPAVTFMIRTKESE